MTREEYHVAIFTSGAIVLDPPGLTLAFEDVYPDRGFNRGSAR